METKNKQIVKLLFRISKSKRAEKDIPYYCRLCFLKIKKGQIFNLIEEEYMECREYFVHSNCLKGSVETYSEDMLKEKGDKLT